MRLEQGQDDRVTMIDRWDPSALEPQLRAPLVHALSGARQTGNRLAASGAQR